MSRQGVCFSITWCILISSILPVSSPVFSQEQPKGLVSDAPITKKMFGNTKDYFKDSVVSKVYKAYKRNDIPDNWHDNDRPPEECVEYKTEESFILYVPQSYDGNKKFGVYLHNSPGQSGITPPEDWREVMDKMNLIFVSPNNTPNKSPSWHRIVLALDSLATVKSNYSIDDKRVFVGGLSGGGHIGMMCQMLYPDIFHGAVSHAAQSYLPEKNTFGHFPGLKPADTQRKPRKDRKWAVVSGDKDQNYNEIIKSGKRWEDAKFKYKFFNVPGMGHNNASGKVLEEILIWLGA